MADKSIPPTVSFHYVKTTDYRTVLATGAIGGVNAQGLINMNFYTDRTSIPRKITHSVTDKLQLGEESGRESVEGSIREIQFGTLFDVETGKLLIQWINEQIALIEQLKK